MFRKSLFHLKYDYRKRSVCTATESMRFVFTICLFFVFLVAIASFGLSISGCNHQFKTHPPLDKRIENVENELQRLEKIQREKQINDQRTRTNNVEY